MNSFRSLLVLLLSALFMVACAEDKLVTDVLESPAGRTFLVVSKKAGCKAVLIDDAPWPTPLDTPGDISPGRHQIRCGSDQPVTFKVQQGTTLVIYGWVP